jgi:bis(5'-nucleosyl)-tetraphosphatase (symmetrical)
VAVYAIGDIQGCYKELRSLLDKIGFRKKKDHLWFTGDLVNRGPNSLEVLRFVRDLDDRAITVLGNHDLHLLAVAEDIRTRSNRSLRAVLDAPDRDELLTWLRHRPLLHFDADLDWVLIHAGMPPQWDLKTAIKCARKVEKCLVSRNYKKLLKRMYGNRPAQWSGKLKGMDRHRFVINCLTRLRYCDKKGRLLLTGKSSPKTAGKGLIPWFGHPDRLSADTRIVFGHWSTLGYFNSNKLLALDTGCVWGGALTAARIDVKKQSKIKRTRLTCSGALKPAKLG